MTLDDLILKYADDRASLSEEELDALIAGLRAAPERAVQLRQHLLVDDLVSQKLAFDRRNFPAQVQQRIADYERGEVEIQNQVVELRTLAESPLETAAGRGRDTAWWKISLAVAVLFLVVFAAIAPQFGSRTRISATVESAQSATVLQAKAGEALLVPGQVVATGQAITTAAGGSLKLRFVDRTLLEIGPDSVVTLDTDGDTRGKLVRLDRGGLIADVSKQRAGEPMLFATPHAVATVLGTRLRLSVDDLATRLDVLEGRVELRRRADQQTLLVSTNESGVAAIDNLALHELRWPDNRTGMIFLYDGNSEQTLVRSPQQPEVLHITRLEFTGLPNTSPPAADVGHLDLRSGYFHSSEAGDDLLPLFRATNELSLEVVFRADAQPAAVADSSLLPIIALADASAANFMLAEQENELVFQLSLAANSALRQIRLGRVGASRTHHLSLAFRSGQLNAWLDGRPLLDTADIRGSFAHWQPQELQIGGAAGDQSAWRGSIAAIALYNRCLTESELERNRRNYAQIHVPQ